MSFTRIDANNISPSGVAAGTYTNPTITINSSGQVTDASSGQLAQGIQGLQGIIGPQGVQGFGGIQGSSGYIGSDGVQGIQGIQGAGAGLAVAEYTTYTYTGNGTTTTFAATSGLTVHTVLVVVDGVTQTPATNYTISGSNVVLSSAPPSGSVVQLRVLGGLIGPQGISGSGGSSVTISSIEVTNSSYAVLDDTAVSVNGGYIKITGTGFVSGCQVVVGSAVASSVTYVSSTVVHCQVPAQTAGTYTVYLTNPNGSVAIRVNGINYSSTPTWTTTSPLPEGVKNTAISIQLAATSNSAITYSLASGSTLPSGLTLSTSGLLSGTVTTITADTAYNFTIVATDQENQDTPQAFQITIVAGDPYYEYVTLHLPGTGTNLATNNTFLDSSTNNFTITRSGNTTQGTFSPFSQTGWSNYFPATSDTTANKISGTITAFGTGNFTVAFWVNIQGVTYSGGFATSQNIVDGQDMFLIQVNSSNQLQVVDRTTSTIVIAASSSTAIPYNQWTNVALIRSGTGTNQTKLYVNGTEVGSATISTNFTGTTLSLGSRFTSSGGIWGPLYGYLSNFIYVDSALSPTTPTSPYTNVPGTRLLTCQSNRFVDNSSSPVTLTATSNVSVVPFSPFNPTASWSAAANGGSGYFDGNGDYLSLANNAAFDFGSGDFTIDCWFYLTGDASANNDGLRSATIFNAFPNSANLNTDYSLGIAGNSSTTGTSIGFNRRASGTSTTLTYTATITKNVWHYVCIVRSGSTLTMYYDGSQVAQNTSFTGNVDTGGNPVKIGALAWFPSGASYGQYFPGYISGLKVVKGVANTPSGVPTSPPTQSTGTSLLLNFTNAGIYDATSKNDLETVGNAQISTTQSKFGGSSIYVDGTGDALVSPYSVNYQLGTGNFTIEMWFYIAANSDQDAGGNRNATMIESRDVAGTSDGMFVIIQGNATTTGTGISFGIRTGGTTYSYAYTGSISQTTWQHLAVVRSGTTCTTYLNGTSVASNSSFGYDIQSVSNMYIGSSPITGFTRVFNGYLQGLRITKGYARYTANFTPPTAAFPTL